MVKVEATEESPYVTAQEPLFGSMRISHGSNHSSTAMVGGAKSTKIVVLATAAIPAKVNA